jgi:hypothetical protein
LEAGESLGHGKSSLGIHAPRLYFATGIGEFRGENGRVRGFHPYRKSRVKKVVPFLAGLLILIGFTFTSSRSMLVDKAREKANLIWLEGHNFYRCEVHWPETLEELIPQGNRIALGNDRVAFLDPWGKRYNFCVLQDAIGDEVLIIYTYCPYGTGTEIIQWPPKPAIQPDFPNK